MNSQSGSIPTRLLGRLAKAIYRHPRWFTYPQALLFLLCLLYTARNLDFNTDRNALVGSDKKYHHIFLAYKEEFPAQDDLVVVVESEDFEKNRQFVERLGARLEGETNLFTDAFFKGDLKMLGAKALLFVPEEDLGGMKQALREYRPLIEQFTRATNFTGLFDLVNTQFRTAPREKDAQTESLVAALPVLERIVQQAAACLSLPGMPPSPGVNALFNAGPEAERQIYITFAGGRLYLVTARARETDLNPEAVDRLRALVAETRLEVPGVNAGITGEPVLEQDEMAQAQRDMTLASAVALVACALIFIYAYRETGRPIKATLCLLVGLVYTLAFATWSIGYLNILTLTFVPILIGLAIDFGVHLITRYEEELRHGSDERAALGKALVFTGHGVFTGALTTGGAFLAMILTDFKGIREMGIICGGGILICLVPMMTLLPALLLRGRQNVLDHQLAGGSGHRARFEKLLLRRPAWITAGFLVVSGLAVIPLRSVYFDYNLLNLQSEGLPAVEYEKKLIHSSAKSVLYGAVIADTLDDAVVLEEKLQALPSVAAVESMSRFLAEDQSGKLRLIGEIKAEMRDLRFAESDTNLVNIDALSQTLWSLQGYLGAAAQEVKAAGEQLLYGQLISLRDAISSLRRMMLGSDAEVAAERLSTLQRAFFEDVRDTFLTIKSQDNRSPLQVGDLPDPLRNRFIGASGKYLLHVYPKENIWERGNQKEFIEQVRTVDPDFTGTPVQLYEYTTLLKQSYEQAAAYALVVIAILVFLHFRSLVCVALALVPVALGSLWMAGLMGWLDIPFNPANIMTLPLVIGIGVTNGIHILNRFAEEQSPVILGKSTGKAVLVSGLTTIAGFGSLILARHQGIESLGYVMAIGVGTCMIAGLTFLPALLKLLPTAWVGVKNPVATMHGRHWVGRNRG